MYRRIEDFLKDWGEEVQATDSVFAALTDPALSQAVAAGHRNLGRMAWHIVGTIPEMMNRTGLKIGGPDPSSSAPSRVSTVRTAYSQAANSLVQEIKANWNDDTLGIVDEMYGPETRWERGATLFALMMHQSHHRGQMTVLMRQAGLRPPSIYGPTLEEWDQFGMKPPEV